MMIYTWRGRLLRWDDDSEAWLDTEERAWISRISSTRYRAIWHDDRGDVIAHADADTAEAAAAACDAACREFARQALEGLDP